ncbi:MAG: hypothetical protein ACKON9_05005 [Planctomycetaceae bacterium]
MQMSSQQAVYCRRIAGLLAVRHCNSCRFRSVERGVPVCGRGVAGAAV